MLKIFKKKKDEVLRMGVFYPGKGIREIEIKKSDLSSENFLEYCEGPFDLEAGATMLNTNVQIGPKVYNAQDFPSPLDSHYAGCAYTLACDMLSFRRKLRREEEQIRNWVNQKGTPVQKVRYERGLLDEKLVVNAMNKEVFQPLENYQQVKIPENLKTRPATAENIDDDSFQIYLEMEKIAKRVSTKAEAHLIEVTVNDVSSAVVEVIIPNGNFDFVNWYYPTKIRQDSFSVTESCKQCGYMWDAKQVCEPCPKCSASKDLMSEARDNIPSSIEDYFPVTVEPQQKEVENG
jgi:rubrerythrin